MCRHKMGGCTVFSVWADIPQALFDIKDLSNSWAGTFEFPGLVEAPRPGMVHPMPRRCQNCIATITSEVSFFLASFVRVLQNLLCLSRDNPNSAKNFSREAHTHRDPSAFFLVSPSSSPFLPGNVCLLRLHCFLLFPPFSPRRLLGGRFDSCPPLWEDAPSLFVFPFPPPSASSPSFCPLHSFASLLPL